MSEVNPEATAGEAVDPGPPIQALAGLEEDPGPQFLAGVRRRIDRRLLAVDVFHLFGSGVFAVLMEFLHRLFQLAGRTERSKREE